MLLCCRKVFFSMSSNAQILANQGNAQLSTGPKTPEGRAISSLNAVKTGLTGRTVLLPGDDAAAYEQHVRRFFTEQQPGNDAENTLVQSLADTEWRLLRIPSLEMGIYALGRIELANKFESADPAVQSALIDAQIFVTYQRQLANLSIQEGRLRKHREKDQAALEDLQTERYENTRIEVDQATKLYLEAKKAGRPFDPTEFGFEISMQDIEERVAFNEARKAEYPKTVAGFLAGKRRKIAA